MTAWSTLRAWLRHANLKPTVVARSLAASTVAQLAANALSLGAPLLLCLAWSQHQWENPLARIAVPLVIIELMAFFRSPLRYLDRMASHRLGFLAVTQWRVWLTRRVAQWSTRSTHDTARAELLQQSIRDVEQIQDLWLRVALPLASSLVAFVLTGVIVAFGIAVALPGASTELWLLAGIGGVALGATALLAAQLAPAVRRQRDVRRAQRDGFGELFDRQQLATELTLLGSAGRDPHFDTPTAYPHGVSQLSAYEAWWWRRDLASAWVSGTLTSLASLVCVVVVVTTPHASNLRVGIGVIGVLVANLTNDLLTQWRQGLSVAASVVVTLEGLEQRSEHAVREYGSAAWPEPVTEYNFQDVFACTPGSHIAITGPSGAGKSTWLRSLAGLEHAGAAVMVNDTYLNSLTDEARRDHVGYVPTEPHFLGTSLHDELTLGRTDLLDYGPLLDALGLPKDRERKIITCSRGERHRYAIVRALIGRPDLLLLDEPTAGLGDHERGPLLAVLKRSGATLIIATHDPLVASACDVVIPVEAFRG